MIKFKSTTVGLAILDAALLGLAFLLFIRGEKTVHQSDAIALDAFDAPTLAAAVTTESHQLATALIRDQSVFHANRAFYEPAPPSQLIPAPNYVLAGVMLLPSGKKTAFLTHATDHTTRTVHEGDELDAWRVQLIDKTRIVVIHDDQREELASSTTQAASGLIRGGAPSRSVAAGTRILGGQRTMQANATIAGSGESPHTFRLPPNEK